MDGENSEIVFYLTEEFKSLNEKWQQKLKDKGFRDVEDSKSEYLKNWDSHYFFRHYSPDEFAETETYYSIARDFYWNYQEFKNKLHRRIWELHADGYSRRKIAQILKQTRIKISDGSVQIVVSSLQKIMHSGLWTSSEKRESNDVTEEPDYLSRLSPR